MMAKFNPSNPPPRDPDLYTETDHYPDAFDDPMRFITRDMAQDAIVNGADFWDQGGANKVRRKVEYEGVNAVVVIALDKPVLVTAWTEIQSYTKAIASDRWSFSDLEKIRAFMDKEHKGRWWEDV